MAWCWFADISECTLVHLGPQQEKATNWDLFIVWCCQTNIHVRSLPKPLAWLLVNTVCFTNLLSFSWGLLRGSATDISSRPADRRVQRWAITWICVERKRRRWGYSAINKPELKNRWNDTEHFIVTVKVITYWKHRGTQTHSACPGRQNNSTRGGKSTVLLS